MREWDCSLLQFITVPIILFLVHCLLPLQKTLFQIYGICCLTQFSCCVILILLHYWMLYTLHCFYILQSSSNLSKINAQTYYMNAFYWVRMMACLAQFPPPASSSLGLCQSCHPLTGDAMDWRITKGLVCVCVFMQAHETGTDREQRWKWKSLFFPIAFKSTIIHSI